MSSTSFHSNNDGTSNQKQDPALNGNSHPSSFISGSRIKEVPTASSTSPPSSSASSSSSPKKASPSDIIFGTNSSSKDVKSLASLGLSSDSHSNTPVSTSHSTQSSRIQDQPSVSNPQTSNFSSASSDPNFSNQRRRSSAMVTDVPDPNTTTTAVLNSTITGAPIDPVSKDQVRLLPPNFEDAEPDDIAVLVADMLTRLISHNDQLPLHPSSLTRFHSRATPGITIASYLRRIAKYTSLDKACTLILLVYIDRVCERLEGFTICGLTVHRFTCAAVVCASKALCDAFSTNGHYARVGGISLVELNMLEKEFLSIIDWRLTCSGALLQHYYVSLVKSHPAYRLSETATVPAPSLAGMSLNLDPSTTSRGYDSSAQAQPSAIDPTSYPQSPSKPISAKSSHEDGNASHNSRMTPMTRSRSRSRSTSKQRKSSRRRTEDFDPDQVEDTRDERDADWSGNQRDVEMFEGDRESRARVAPNGEIQSGVG